MMMPIMVGSIIGTIVIAILSVMTLTEGYGYKHKVDPPINKEEDEYTYKTEKTEEKESF